MKQEELFELGMNLDPFCYAIVLDGEFIVKNSRRINKKNIMKYVYRAAKKKGNYEGRRTMQLKMQKLIDNS
jgi:hypothetical protein